MTAGIPINEFGGGANAAKFDKLGDKHEGTIATLPEQRQQTDLKTGQPRVFPSGAPMMLWIITLETASGETIALWAKGGSFKAVNGSGDSMQNAIVRAVKDSGASSIDVGGRLAVAWTGTGEEKPGMSAPKLFTAQYQPPAPKPESVPLDLFSDS